MLAESQETNANYRGYQMAEGSAHSRYVKLTKDQGPLEDIKPGELNQPIEVPQVFSLSLSLSLREISGFLWEFYKTLLLFMELELDPFVNVC